jgi:hypothetical protein
MKTIEQIFEECQNMKHYEDMTQEERTEIDRMANEMAEYIWEHKAN